MNLPFNVKFIIFDENKEITKQQQKLKFCINEKIKDILKNKFNHDINYKFLDRMEASLSSIDENKQIRLRIDTAHTTCKKYQHSLHFHQKHSCSKEYFTIDELKYISNKIKFGLEKFLHYEIDEPIIYIEIDEL
jgi:hypothetical protein